MIMEGKSSSILMDYAENSVYSSYSVLSLQKPLMESSDPAKIEGMLPCVQTTRLSAIILLPRSDRCSTLWPRKNNIKGESHEITRSAGIEKGHGESNSP